VRLPPNLTVGYVMGSGDDVPTALRQLGANVQMLDADELAWGNLSRYDAIVTGVRAYEKRPDLMANNQRILDYATKGGTVIVQYNRHDRPGFNDAQLGPYPAKVTINRVTKRALSRFRIRKAFISILREKFIPRSSRRNRKCGLR